MRTRQSIGDFAALELVPYRRGNKPATVNIAETANKKQDKENVAPSPKPSEAAAQASSSANAPTKAGRASHRSDDAEVTRQADVRSELQATNQAHPSRDDQVQPDETAATSTASATIAERVKSRRRSSNTMYGPAYPQYGGPVPFNPAPQFQHISIPHQDMYPNLPPNIMQMPVGYNAPPFAPSHAMMAPRSRSFLSPHPQYDATSTPSHAVPIQPFAGPSQERVQPMASSSAVAASHGGVEVSHGPQPGQPKMKFEYSPLAQSPELMRPLPSLQAPQPTRPSNQLLEQVHVLESQIEHSPNPSHESLKRKASQQLDVNKAGPRRRSNNQFTPVGQLSQSKSAIASRSQRAKSRSTQQPASTPHSAQQSVAEIEKSSTSDSSAQLPNEKLSIVPPTPQRQPLELTYQSAAEAGRFGSSVVAEPSLAKTPNQDSSLPAVNESTSKAAEKKSNAIDKRERQVGPRNEARTSSNDDSKRGPTDNTEHAKCAQRAQGTLTSESSPSAQDDASEIQVSISPDTTGLSRSQAAALRRLTREEASNPSSAAVIVAIPSARPTEQDSGNGNRSEQDEETTPHMQSDQLPLPEIGISSHKPVLNIAKYSRHGEDLDWTKVMDKHERKRLQNIISSRKYKTTKISKNMPGFTASEDKRDSGSSPGKTSRSLRSSRKPQEDQVTETSATPSVVAPPLTREEALALSDDEFISNTKVFLEAASRGSTKSSSFSARQARRIRKLLDEATPFREGEALVCVDVEQAAQQLQANVYYPNPIFIAGQQSLPLQTVDSFLAEMYDDNMEVHVQDPDLKVANDAQHIKRVTIGKVKERFAKPCNGSPWNLLELATHYDEGIRPAFLNSEECRLLTKLKFPNRGDTASRKGYDPGWKEVEKWALIAQAGALTEPHQDSHGYNTFITINQGIFGYGWLSDPTVEQRAAWAASPDHDVDGRWRYAILRPGQTVYFPTATIHFVFRLPAAGNTLAFGGHVLRNSQIVRWVKCLIDEKKDPNLANEDLTVSAPAYLGRVSKFVKQALKRGDEVEMEKWGGKDAILEFLKLKGEFDKMGK
ncbi:hypothetical protein KC331_g2711 [Hortaea werneckii]|uniref:JmjC domain-containing protein n=1 Tax=Hortaea werneckii TaxID=91943 RepID=A0A3M7C9M6_HORWE|nr:hypothetical protein KC331_g2711 [Hortaea werneckii]KAI7721367.1 hypothetical protein KC353_g1406 [Hortaea werneckii]RMY48695.1 hypothetical protein D0865_07934 [Hortaea werneckii]